MLVYYLQTIDSPEHRRKFERLYLEYRDCMYHIAFSILRHTQDAEDAVHTAFMRVAEHIALIRTGNKGQCRSLLCTMARNAAIDIYRKRRDIGSCSDAEIEELPDTCDLEQSLSVREPLTRAILALPQKQRDALYLRCLYGYTTAETARLLGTTPEHIRTLIMRARQTLRRNAGNGEGAEQ